MRAENLKSNERNDRQLNTVLLVLGSIAVAASAMVAWPALAYLGAKLI